MGTNPMEALADRIQTIRRFNRLYTGKIGLLQSKHLGTQYSLTEARILFELGRCDGLTARRLCDDLGLDQGYVSRILSRFERDGLISRRASEEDGRVQHIVLSKSGRRAQAMLDAKASEAIATLLHDKTESEQRALTGAAQTFMQILGHTTDAPMFIRQPEPGDIGWIIHRHGTVIAKEFGWDGRFETTIAEILGQYGRHPGRELGWIVERDGEILGSVFVMPDDEKTARLRVLYVEPAARGLGLGKRLVDLAVGFARDARYNKLVLWTHHFQTAARKVYQAAGFRLVHSEKTHSFGVEVVSETWEMEFKPRSARARSPA
jgi:DNA-binding MarR family transcriptional regulator/GNAT superfamily N-acetyltransferase